MQRNRTIALAVAGLLAATVAFAHHAPASLGTVRITQPVMAGGTMLQPGTYTIRDTGEHMSSLPGQSPDAMTWVEFVANGKVVARDGAELTDMSNQAVGTSGQARASRPRVERLKGDEFLRISTTSNGERYLIHLPLMRH
jgi:hypothetical protein